MDSRKDRIEKLQQFGPFRLGALTVDPGRQVVLCDEGEILLKLRQMEVLVALVEASNQRATKKTLLEKIWRNTNQSDNVVEKVIHDIRRQLKPHFHGDDFIKSSDGGYTLKIPAARDQSDRPSAPSVFWRTRSPYVGLEAYSGEHTDVFFGRTRATAQLFEALRKQIDNGRRFVFVAGASGCGKTSLLRAGILPKLGATEPKGMHAIAVAHCNLASAQGGDTVELLAASLMTWRIDGRPLFSSSSVSDLAQQLVQHPESIEQTIEDAFNRAPHIKRNLKPRAHLLMVIDHAETLVASKSISQEERNDFARLIDALCESRYALTAMLARSDFPTLIESMPDLAERQAGEGHVHVLGPSRGEIGEIIRRPAEIADLSFEFDAESRMRLDETLRDAAAEHADTLPMLQHTLHSLYQSSGDSRTLTFAAYRDIGGLEGAIAHRAEEVYGELPEDTQHSLAHVFSLLIEIRAEQDIISARQPSFSMLQNQHAQTLVETFIKERLFVAGEHAGQRNFGVVHEALLRQWPRAQKWAQDNRRMLQSRARLAASAERWKDEGRRRDHLLNPGRPLAEALEVAAAASPPLTDIEREFVAISNRQKLRAAQIRAGMIFTLATLSIAATALALLAFSSRGEAFRLRLLSSELIDFMTRELADELDVKADMKLIEAITGEILSNCDDSYTKSALTSDILACSRASRKLGEVRMDQANIDQAESLIERSVALSEAARKREPTSSSVLNEAGQAYAWLGRLRDRQNEPDRAKQAWQKFLAAAGSLAENYPNTADSIMQKSYAHRNLGYYEMMEGQEMAALTHFRKSEKLNIDAISIDNENKPIYRYEWIVASSFISRIYSQTGDLRAAKSAREIQITSLKRLLDKNPSARDWELQLANLLYFHADVALDLGDSTAAKKSIGEAIERLTWLCKKEPKNDEWAKFLAQAYLLASDIAISDGNKIQSISHLVSALGSIRINKSSPLAWQRVKATILVKLAMNERSEGSAQKANDAIQKLREIVRIANDRHSKMALAEALLLKARRERAISGENPHEESIEEALTVLSTINRNSKDPKVIGLTIRAEISKNRNRPNCEKILAMELISYKNPEYEKSVANAKALCELN